MNHDTYHMFNRPFSAKIYSTRFLHFLAHFQYKFHGKKNIHFYLIKSDFEILRVKMLII